MRVAAGALLALVLTAGPALADPTPTPTVQEPEAPLTVAVTDLLPRAPQPGQAFEVKGAIRNSSQGLTVTDPQVRLARGDVISSRGELHQAQAEPPDYGRHFAPRPLYASPSGGRELDALGPGQVGYFDIQTDVDSLQLGRTGVYPLGVEARGRVDDTGTQVLGSADTWVPFFAADAKPRQNKVALLVPVTAKPTQTPDGSFADDSLRTSLATGQLHRLLTATAAAARPSCDKGAVRNDKVQDPPTTRCAVVPVAYAVDPDLVSAAVAMTQKGYRVGTGKDRHEGTGGPVAQKWLGDLKAQTGAASGSVLVLPYADPDVDALAATEAGRLDVADAVKLGNQVLTPELLPGSRVDAVLPPSQGSGILSVDAASALAPATAQRFAYVLDESAFPDVEDTGRSRSPSAPVDLGPTSDPLHALVVEDDLSTLLLGGTRDQEGSRLAEQRFIAETAIIAAEAPGSSRTFVISPDRYSDLDVQAAADAIRDVGRLPWLCPVDLESVTQGTESCPAPTSSRETRQVMDENDPRTGLRSGTDAQLPADYLQHVAQQQRRATQLTSQVLGTGTDAQKEDVADTISALQRRLHQAVARAESSAWRQDPEGQARTLDRLNGAMNALVGQVSVLAGRILLTSDKGAIQVAVENASDLPVEVRLEFTIPGRKDVLETKPVVVPPKRSVPASVQVSGLRSGTFPIRVQMKDRAGKAFRGTVTVQVRSTRYGRLALGVTFAAAGVLFVAAGTRIVRRSLRRSPTA